MDQNPARIFAVHVKSTMIQKDGIGIAISDDDYLCADDFLVLIFSSTSDRIFDAERLNAFAS